jgi:hypothetical protein
MARSAADSESPSPNGVQTGQMMDGRGGGHLMALEVYVKEAAVPWPEESIMLMRDKFAR